jgi:hypothetical protein
MNYTESFQEFSSRVSPTDLALYAGAGLILWVLFSDRLGPVKEFGNKLLNNFTKRNQPNVPVNSSITKTKNTSEPQFLELVSSWKQTRDLAESLNCKEAVKIVDQMFPLLVPSACAEENNNDK